MTPEERDAIIRETKATSFEANPRKAISLALRLGCAAVEALADIAEDLHAIRALFGDEAERRA
jgi:hypothetical protein